MIWSNQRRHGPSRPWTYWAALLALLVQALVVQPHIDRLPVGRGAEVAGVTAHADARAEPFDHQDQTCIICQAGAAGAATLVSPPALLALLAFVLLAASTLPRTLVLGPPGHIWRSRAPPLFL